MRHSNESIETKTTWRLNTAAILESLKQEKEIRREKKKKAIRYTNKNPVHDHSALSKAENTKTPAMLFDFCAKIAKVCLFYFGAAEETAKPAHADPHHM